MWLAIVVALWTIIVLYAAYLFIKDKPKLDDSEDWKMAEWTPRQE